MDAKFRKNFSEGSQACRLTGEQSVQVVLC